MKRLLLLVLAMSLIVGMAFADGGIGLTVGVGYVEPNTDEDDDEFVPISVEYENVFMDGALEVTAELIYNQPLGKMPDPDDLNKEVTKDGNMSIELEGLYNINENMAAILNFMVDMTFEEKKMMNMWLTPGFRYKQTFGFGDFWAQANVPLSLSGTVAGIYIDENGQYYDKDGKLQDYAAMDFVNLELIFSFMRLRDKGEGLGFGGELALKSCLSDATNDDADFLQYLHLTPYYENELLYAEMEVVMPLYKDGMKLTGLTIIPEIEVNLPPIQGLSVWLNVPISGIGADDVSAPTLDDPNATESAMSFGFGVGVKFAF